VNLKVNCKCLNFLFPLLLAASAPICSVAQSFPPDGPGIPSIALTGEPASQEPAPNPPDQQSQWNMELAGFSDLQGRSAYQPIIINEGGREIAYVGHHTGSMINPLTGVVEPNGTSIVDVTDPAKPKYLRTFPAHRKRVKKRAARRWCAYAAEVCCRTGCAANGIC
jgi:hypothetical protein